MTIDEAIEHAEEVAEDKERSAGWVYDKESASYKKKCIKCAEEHRQLAEWLKDYKRLKEKEPCEDAISRQAVLDEAFEVDTKEYGRIDVVGVDAIVALPPVTPQPKHCTCTDEDIAKAFQFGVAFGFGKRYDEMDRVIEEIKKVITPQPKTVIYSGDGYADGYMVYDMAECPNCGYEYEDGDKDWELPFCPSCGQKLNWESEEV